MACTCYTALRKPGRSPDCSFLEVLSHTQPSTGLSRANPLLPRARAGYVGLAFTPTPGEMPNSDIVYGYVRNNDSVAFVHDFYAVVRQGLRLIAEETV